MWELVPTPEGKNFVGSPWVLKVKHNEEGSMDRFEASIYVKSGKEANACISSTKLGVYVNGIISVSTTLKC